jgi:hypothetical protein
MRRGITVFDSENDCLVATYPLHNIETDVLQRLWNRPIDDPMPEEYAIED